MIPADAELTPRHDEIPAWDDMPDELKPVLARQMEVYAGFLEHTDHHVGRLIDALEDLEILDDTIVYYIIGDNGASAEGTMNGAFNEMANFNGMAALETPEFMLSKMDEFGSPSSYNHYSVGWAWAMNTPFQWTKQVASHWGGTRNGTIVHWPHGIEERGGLRSQFTHVIDVAPTILEAAGLPEPTMVNGVLQSPMEGTSMAYYASTRRLRRSVTTSSTSRCSATGASTTAAGARSPSTRPRGSWSAATCRPSTTTSGSCTTASTDYSQASDLAAEHPEMLAKLQRLWLIEATKYNVLPLDDRSARAARTLTWPDGRRSSGATRSCSSPGMGRLSENSVVSIKNKSFSVTADVDVPEGGANGVLIAQGGRFGGWSFYVKDGKAQVHLQRARHPASSPPRPTYPIPDGNHQVRMEFAYDGEGLAKGGDVDPLPRRRAGRVRTRSERPSRWSSPPTRPPTSATSRAPR